MIKHTLKIGFISNFVINGLQIEMMELLEFAFQFSDLPKWFQPLFIVTPVTLLAAVKMYQDPQTHFIQNLPALIEKFRANKLHFL